MAQRHLAVAENAPGELFVDSTCIECDTCRELAPDVFGSTESGQSFVLGQPANEPQWRRALWAVVSCPTASMIPSACLALMIDAVKRRNFWQISSQVNGFRGEPLWGLVGWV